MALEPKDGGRPEPENRGRRCVVARGQGTGEAPENGKAGTTCGGCSTTTRPCDGSVFACVDPDKRAAMRLTTSTSIVLSLGLGALAAGCGGGGGGGGFTAAAATAAPTGSGTPGSTGPGTTAGAAGASGRPPAPPPG